mmetsp:Transcript_4328/g.19303  ORF Transcript_4328/g.19303 Transcript_4328/m.19303 type:complete len:206 (+) Transcript_4328:2735-3352(+)
MDPRRRAPPIDPVPSSMPTGAFVPQGSVHPRRARVRRGRRRRHRVHRGRGPMSDAGQRPQRRRRDQLQRRVRGGTHQDGTQRRRGLRRDVPRGRRRGLRQTERSGPERGGEGWALAEEARGSGVRGVGDVAHRRAPTAQHNRQVPAHCAHGDFAAGTGEVPRGRRRVARQGTRTQGDASAQRSETRLCGQIRPITGRQLGRGRRG